MNTATSLGEIDLIVPGTSKKQGSTITVKFPDHISRLIQLAQEAKLSLVEHVVINVCLHENSFSKQENVLPVNALEGLVLLKTFTIQELHDGEIDDFDIRLTSRCEFELPELVHQVRQAGSVVQKLLAMVKDNLGVRCYYRTQHTYLDHSGSGQVKANVFASMILEQVSAGPNGTVQQWRIRDAAEDERTRPEGQVTLWRYDYRLAPSERLRILKMLDIGGNH